MKQMIKPTKEQFEDYIAIRDSGITNMFDIPFVCAISQSGLSEGNCRYIMVHFLDLAREFNVVV